MPDVTVVSGTYNRLPLLKKMVASARTSAGDLSLEFVLVDGGSTDGSIEWCKAQPDVTLITHGKLLGAILAYNDGFKMARGRYVVIGNDDVTFDGDSIQRAYRYLEANPEVGQAAFYHRYQRRGPQAAKGIFQRAHGYVYGQCSMVRKWLGDLAEWWGQDGMKTYGGDTRLSLRLWEMGWPVVPVDGCSVTDSEHQDELRKVNSDSPWKRARDEGKPHPDLIAFGMKWDNRLPPPEGWVPSPPQRVLRKAMQGNLRTMRFKGMMRQQDEPRRALIDALARYGPAVQVNQNAEAASAKDKWQERIIAIVNGFRPDLLILQAQRPGPQAITPETVWALRQKMPWMFIANFDGDTHYPLETWHFEIARAVHLQLVVSPTLFPQYAARGIGVAYWPIGIERPYLEATRGPVDGPDVLFTGALYGIGMFPEAEFRRDAVLALSQSGLALDLYGYGWQNVGLPLKQTVERHAENAAMMARAKMTLSVSQSADLWGYTSDRLYNITATGCPALVQRFAGMEQHGYVDGKTCIAFKTIPEMLDKARYYLRHEDEREAIGAAGRAMTHRRHTWEARVEALWCMLGGL
jgi:hypothetical protein